MAGETDNILSLDKVKMLQAKLQSIILQTLKDEVPGRSPFENALKKDLFQQGLFNFLNLHINGERAAEDSNTPTPFTEICLRKLLNFEEKCTKIMNGDDKFKAAANCALSVMEKFCSDQSQEVDDTDDANSVDYIAESRHRRGHDQSSGEKLNKKAKRSEDSMSKSKGINVQAKDVENGAPDAKNRSFAMGKPLLSKRAVVIGKKLQQALDELERKKLIALNNEGNEILKVDPPGATQNVEKVVDQAATDEEDIESYTKLQEIIKERGIKIYDIEITGLQTLYNKKRVRIIIPTTRPGESLPGGFKPVYTKHFASPDVIEWFHVLKQKFSKKYSELSNWMF